MKIEARALTVRYPGSDRAALQDVSVTLDGGELLVIAGPNGSGKSTLMRALLGVVTPVRGGVHLDGRDIGAWSRRELARVVGALAQREEPAFAMRVDEFVLLGRAPHLGPFAAPAPPDRAAAADAARRCDVESLLHRMTDSLSGGEWQRVRLARTLAARPRLLLLDEPTTALDVAHEMALFELLASLAADGIGIAVVTHHLNVAARFAHRVLLMHAGTVAAAGPPDAVMDAAVLGRLFDWPVDVVELPGGGRQFVPVRAAGGIPPSSGPGYSPAGP